MYGIDDRTSDQIIFAIIVQIIVEYITSVICLYIDFKRGTPTNEHWEDRDDGHENTIIIHIIMGVIYMLFSLSFYIITLKSIS